MLLDNKGIEILNQIDSSSPTPGGGSVSALVGALGVCLVRMYGHLTVNKKKFLALDASIQQRFTQNFEEILNQKNDLIQAIDQDCNAYETVMSRGLHLKASTPRNKFDYKSVLSNIIPRLGPNYITLTADMTEDQLVSGNMLPD